MIKNRVWLELHVEWKELWAFLYKTRVAKVSASKTKYGAVHWILHAHTVVI